tara:strand:+ start:282 stop:1349 length:1068 start_codon:yes stop_codon:yes gene_type:complete
MNFASSDNTKVNIDIKTPKLPDKKTITTRDPGSITVPPTFFDNLFTGRIDTQGGLGTLETAIGAPVTKGKSLLQMVKDIPQTVKNIKSSIVDVKKGLLGAYTRLKAGHYGKNLKKLKEVKADILEDKLGQQGLDRLKYTFGDEVGDIFNNDPDLYDLWLKARLDQLTKPGNLTFRTRYTGDLGNYNPFTNKIKINTGRGGTSSTLRHEIQHGLNDPYIDMNHKWGRFQNPHTENITQQYSKIHDAKKLNKLDVDDFELLGDPWYADYYNPDLVSKYGQGHLRYMDNADEVLGHVAELKGPLSRMLKIPHYADESGKSTKIMLDDLYPGLVDNELTKLWGVIPAAYIGKTMLDKDE